MRRSRTRRSTTCARAAGSPILDRRQPALPARGARRPAAAAARRPTCVRLRCQDLYDARGAEAAHAGARAPRSAGRSGDPPERPPARRARRSSCARSGASLRPEADRLWSEEHARAGDACSRSTGRATRCTRRIEQRTDAMLAGGALDEVRAMLRDGPEPSTTARTIHGLRRLRRARRGAHTSLERVPRRASCCRRGATRAASASGFVGSRASTCSRAPMAPSATPSGSWRC